jgi:hypothetical protein
LNQQNGDGVSNIGAKEPAMTDDMLTLSIAKRCLENANCVEQAASTTDASAKASLVTTAAHWRDLADYWLQTCEQPCRNNAEPDERAA